MTASSKTYTSWYEMLKRCYNPRHNKYLRYGGRGIKVVDSWRVFENFVADMGERPEGTTLGRIDNDGQYCPENCRWETAQEQAVNKGLYKNNKSGLKGVAKDRNLWRAYANRNSVRVVLYFGKDFFEAVCARKAWEVKHG